MITELTPSEILGEARKNATRFALLRPESVTIIALTLLCFGLSLADILIPRQGWWVVLVAGIAGQALIFFSTLGDHNLLDRLGSTAFYERFDTEQLTSPELRRNVLKALEFHRDVFQTIRARPEAPLGKIAIAMDSWVIQLYNVAHQVDVFVKDPAVMARFNRLTQISEGDVFGSTDPAQERGLVVVNDRPAAEATDSDYDLFAEAKKAVTGATHELDGSLAAMYHVRLRLTTAHSTDLDRVFSEQVHSMMSTHILRLDQAGSLIQELFSACMQSEHAFEIVDVAQVVTMGKH